MPASDNGEGGFPMGLRRAMFEDSSTDSLPVWRARSGEPDRIDTFDCCLAQCIDVKAACGKTARAV